MVEEIKPIVVCSAFIEKEGKFLLFFCPKFKIWRVPGGKAEFNETLEETLIREMKEEIGVKINKLKFVGWGQDHPFHIKLNKEFPRLLMFFHTKIDEEIKVSKNDAEEYKWVSFDELKAHPNKEGALTDLFNRDPKLKL